LNRFKTGFKTEPVGTVLLGPPVSAPLPHCLAFSHSLPHPATDHRAPLPPGPTCQPLPHHVSCAPLLSLVHTTAPPPAPAGRGPLSGALRCRPLCPPLPPSPTSTRTHPRRPPPPFPLSQPMPPGQFCSKRMLAAVPSPFCPFPSRPRLNHRSRAPPSRANLPVALPSTGAPSAIGIWLAPPLFPLFLGAPPSVLFLSKSTALTHLSLPLTCRVRRRSSGTTRGHWVIGAPPSRSASSASMLPARSDGFPPSLGRPVHSLCNTAALGVGPAAPRAPTHRR
jgi:hypothetical protein